MHIEKTITFFDFDGTIPDGDSLPKSIQYMVGRRAYYLGLIYLSPLLIAYKVGLIPNHRAKEALFHYFFKGDDSVHFQQRADAYSLEQIPTILRPQAVQRILWH